MSQAEADAAAASAQRAAESQLRAEAQGMVDRAIAVAKAQLATLDFRFDETAVPYGFEFWGGAQGGKQTITVPMNSSDRYLMRNDEWSLQVNLRKVDSETGRQIAGAALYEVYEWDTVAQAYMPYNLRIKRLDHWIDSQWIEHPITEKYSYKLNSNGGKDLGHAYRAMKTTGLKEMYIVRYADDFRILCRTRSEAERIKTAVTKWLFERLKLEISPEKTRVVNVKKKYSEFLGFKIKVHRKGEKWTVLSHVCDKALCKQKQSLIEQAKKVVKPPAHSTESYELHLYNAKVIGAQNYYKIATHVNLDFNGLNRAIMTVFINRLRTQKGSRLTRTGRPLTKAEKGLYGNTPMMRYIAGTKEPIYPIGFVQHKPPWTKKRKSNLYSPEGRQEIHDNLRINTSLMVQLMNTKSNAQSTEFSDNRISLFSAQWGKCAVTGKEFQCLEDIHCHHKLPKSLGGTDKYENLVLVLPQVHRLIHATDTEIIQKYLHLLNLDKAQIAKLNKYREKANNEPLKLY